MCTISNSTNNINIYYQHNKNIAEQNIGTIDFTSEDLEYFNQTQCVKNQSTREKIIRLIADCHKNTNIYPYHSGFYKSFLEKDLHIKLIIEIPEPKAIVDKILMNPYVHMIQGLKPIADDCGNPADMKSEWIAYKGYYNDDERNEVKKILLTKTGKDIEIDTTGKIIYYSNHWLHLLSEITKKSIPELLRIPSSVPATNKEMELIYLMYGNWDIIQLIDKKYLKNFSPQYQNWYNEYRHAVLSENSTYQIYGTMNNLNPKIVTENIPKQPHQHWFLSIWFAFCDFIHWIYHSIFG